MRNSVNPFLINGYISPEYFCNREEETKTLIENISNNANTTFFALRRLGKTALIQHVFHLLRNKKHIECIYLDIYATRNLKEFTNQLANSIYKVFPENRTIGKKFWEAIKLFRPIISVDTMTGSPELSLDITQPKQYEKTIPQLLQFLDDQKMKTVIAIDEFQQILTYPEKNVEALLRTVIQQLKNVNFIFCGSNQAMMHELFNSAKRPFYASTKTVHLKKIDKNRYADFIKTHFEKNKFKINDNEIDYILEYTNYYTYYTQYLCHQLFLGDQTNINTDTILATIGKILKGNEGTYFQYRNLITSAQWNLLKAIAVEETVIQPYSKQFINKHSLGSSAMVKRGIESLIQKEMIYYNAGVEQPYYEVYDKFLMRWLQH